MKELHRNSPTLLEKYRKTAFDERQAKNSVEPSIIKLT